MPLFQNQFRKLSKVMFVQVRVKHAKKSLKIYQYVKFFVKFLQKSYFVNNAILN